MMMITTFAAVMWNLLTQLSRLVGPLRCPPPPWCSTSPQFDSLIYGGQPFKLAFHHRLLLCAAYCCQEIKEACKIERRHSTKAVNWELIFQKEWENSKCGLNISFLHDVDIYFLYTEWKNPQFNFFHFKISVYKNNFFFK